MSGQLSWADATRSAIRRLSSTSGSDEFERSALIESELDQIVADVGADGATPAQTLSRILQELRDAGEIEFLAEAGRYRVKHLK